MKSTDRKTILSVDDIVKTIVAYAQTKKTKPRDAGEVIEHGPLAGVVNKWGGLTEAFASRRRIAPELEQFSLSRFINVVLDELQAQGAVMEPAKGIHRGTTSIKVPKTIDVDAVVAGVKKRIQPGFTPDPEKKEAPEIDAGAVYSALLRGAFDEASCQKPDTQIGNHTVAEINEAISGGTFNNAKKYTGEAVITSVLDFARAASVVTTGTLTKSDPIVRGFHNFAATAMARSKIPGPK